MDMKESTIDLRIRLTFSDRVLLCSASLIFLLQKVIWAEPVETLGKTQKMSLVDPVQCLLQVIKFVS